MIAVRVTDARGSRCQISITDLSRISTCNRIHRLEEKAESRVRISCGTNRGRMYSTCFSPVSSLKRFLPSAIADAARATIVRCRRCLHAPPLTSDLPSDQLRLPLRLRHRQQIIQRPAVSLRLVNNLAVTLFAPDQ
jgi:hypothetical protein